MGSLCSLRRRWQYASGQQSDLRTLARVAQQGLVSMTTLVTGCITLNILVIDLSRTMNTVVLALSHSEPHTSDHEADAIASDPIQLLQRHASNVMTPVISETEASPKPKVPCRDQDFFQVGPRTVAPLNLFPRMRTQGSNTTA